MSDGYTIIRRSTLAWLLEHYRQCEDKQSPTAEVIADLRGDVLADVKAPNAEGDRLHAAGPVLSVDEHVALLASDDGLDLPQGKAGEFWRLVARVVHAMLLNESEAILKILGANHGE